MPDMIMTLASLLVAVALYVWVGVTLGRVFRALGGDPWKAWLPLVGQLEMLRLATRPGWHVVLLAVPLYGLVVYYQVLRELTALLGRPTGLASIGVVLLPVWAGAVTGGAKDEAMTGPLGLDSFFGRVSRPAPGAADLSPGHPQVLVPVGAASTPDSPVVAYACPVTVYPEPVMPLRAAPVAPAWSAASPGSAVAPVVAQPVGSPAVASGSAAPQLPALEFPPTTQHSPWSAPAAPAEPSAPAEPAVLPVPVQAVVPQPVAPVVPPGPPPVAVGVPPSAPSASVPASEVLSVTTPPGGAGRSALRPVPSGFEASDHTVAINRVSSRPWSLVLADGRSFDLWASSVVVGRERTATDDGVQMLAIPDDTRTISKMHARFDLVDGVWQVTDLGSTNGIVVTGTDGRDFSVRPGRTSVVGTRLVLGSVAMRLVPRASLARSA